MTGGGGWREWGLCNSRIRSSVTLACPAHSHACVRTLSLDILHVGSAAAGWLANTRGGGWWWGLVREEVANPKPLCWVWFPCYSAQLRVTTVSSYAPLMARRVGSGVTCMIMIAMGEFLIFRNLKAGSPKTSLTTVVCLADPVGQKH